MQANPTPGVAASSEAAPRLFHGQGFVRIADKWHTEDLSSSWVHETSRLTLGRSYVATVQTNGLIRAMRVYEPGELGNLAETVPAPYRSDAALFIRPERTATVFIEVSFWFRNVTGAVSLYEGDGIPDVPVYPQQGAGGVFHPPPSRPVGAGPAPRPVAPPQDDAGWSLTADPAQENARWSMVEGSDCSDGGTDACSVDWPDEPDPEAAMWMVPGPSATPS